MTVDLPPSGPADRPRPAAHTSRASPSQPLQALIQALQLKVGESVQAQVVRTVLVDEQQRQALMQSAQQQSRLTAELRQLLKAPELLLLELNIRGQSLLTYTDKAVSPGQTLEVQLASAARLLLKENVLTGKPAQRTPEQQLIDDSLRTALPRKAPVSQLLQAVDTLLKRLPAATQRELLPAALRQSLQKLQAQIHTPQQLANPATLAQALKRSGMQLEHQLNQVLRPVQGSEKFSPGTPLRAAGNNDFSLDLKGGLLQVLSHLRALAGQDSAGRSEKPLPFQGPREQLPLLLFIQQLAAQSSRHLSHREARNQLIQLLHHQILAALSKIQYQQMQALSQRLSRGFAPLGGQPEQAPQSWQIELPVRYGDHVHSLELRIEDDWVEDPHRNKEDEPKKIRQWEVMLSFDLPDKGAFHAQLKIVNDTVAANFWAERQATLEQAKQQLETLRSRLQASGVVVKDIQCLRGQPPSRDIQLGYSLVDIRT